ncbi:hypothetical protein X975_10039, partial [Stegodyphus mimosarum]
MQVWRSVKWRVCKEITGLTCGCSACYLVCYFVGMLCYQTPINIIKCLLYACMKMNQIIEKLMELWSSQQMKLIQNVLLRFKQIQYCRCLCFVLSTLLLIVMIICISTMELMHMEIIRLIFPAGVHLQMLGPFLPMAIMSRSNTLQIIRILLEMVLN